MWALYVPHRYGLENVAPSRNKLLEKQQKREITWFNPVRITL